MDTTIRIGEPRELLAYLPHQLGFRPQESVVVVSLRDPGASLGMVARADVADLADPEHGVRVARTLVGHAVRDGAGELVLVAYTSQDPRLPGPAGATVRAAVVRLCREADAWDLGRPDVWVVTSTGYLNLGCLVDGCCPIGGRPLRELEGTVVGARMVAAGSCVLDSREALARIPPAPPTARRNAARAGTRWRRRRAEAEALRPDDAAAVARTAWRATSLALWRDLVDQVADEAASGPAPAAPGPAALGRVAVALQDVRVRDAVLLTLVPGAGAAADQVLVDRGAQDETPGLAAAVAALTDPELGVPPPPAATRVHQDVLRAVVAHARVDDQAPALTLLALLAWWQGDGARAAALLERALDADPCHHLAHLLADLLDVGLPPGWASRARDPGGPGE